jgi:hypothetical protein
MQLRTHCRPINPRTAQIMANYGGGDPHACAKRAASGAIQASALASHVWRQVRSLHITFSSAARLSCARICPAR